jgi:hypothetical protein
VSTPAPVSVDAVTADIQARVRERVRQELLRHGASDALSDAAIFADLDALLRNAVRRSQPRSLLMPEMLGDPSNWRLETSVRFDSHRGPAAAGVIMFLKRRLLMPLLRWLFEYSRDNFARQRRVNEVFFACVQELAIENARLRQELERLSRQ